MKINLCLIYFPQNLRFILERLFYPLKFLKLSNKKYHLQKTTRKKFLKKYDFLESILLYKVEFSKKSLLSKNEENRTEDSKKSFLFSKKIENPNDFLVQNFSEKKVFLTKTFLNHLFQTDSANINKTKYFFFQNFFPQKKKVFQYWIFPLLGFAISTWNQTNFFESIPLFSKNSQIMNLYESKNQSDFSYKLFCERKEKTIKTDISSKIENFHNLYFYFLQKKIFFNPKSFYFPIQSSYFSFNPNPIQMFDFIGTKKDHRFFDIIPEKRNFSIKGDHSIFEKNKNSKISPLSNYIKAKILFNHSFIYPVCFEKLDQLKKQQKDFLNNIQRLENFLTKDEFV